MPYKNKGTLRKQPLDSFTDPMARRENINKMTEVTVEKLDTSEKHKVGNKITHLSEFILKKNRKQPTYPKING